MFPSRPLAVSFVLSVTFASYLSKSFGKSTTGCLINFKFPFPPMTTRKVTGLPALTSFLSICAEILNLPTPPEKLAGRVGNGSTSTDKLGATMLHFTSTYPEPPLKKASKGSTARFCWMTVPSKVILGISSFPVICGYITYWLHVTHR